MSAVADRAGAPASGARSTGRSGHASRLDELGLVASPRRAARRASQRPGRVTGVDTARGVLLVVSVTTSSLIAPPLWFDHAAWLGVHPLDLVFPAFVVLTGAGLGFAHKNGVKVARLARRVLVLLVLGLLYGAAGDWARGDGPHLDTLRVTGVLQLYAALVLFIALAHLVTRTWWGWLAITLGLAAAHTALTAVVAARCPGGALTPQCNPSLVVDGALLPTEHLYRQMASGHDPEGLVALLGACATASAGTALAHALVAARRTSASPEAAFPRLLLLAASLGAAASVSSLLVPATKRLWTAPFGLGVAAVTVLAVAVVHVLVDGPWTAGRGGAAAAVRTARWPFVALGRNSLLVYFGSHVLVETLVVRPLGSGTPEAPSYAQQIGQAVSSTSSPGGVQVGLTLVLLAFWWLLAALLHRRGWYVRA